MRSCHRQIWRAAARSGCCSMTLPVRRRSGIRLAPEAASAIIPPRLVPSIRAAADLLSWPGGQARESWSRPRSCLPPCRAGVRWPDCESPVCAVVAAMHPDDGSVDHRMRHVRLRRRAGPWHRAHPGLTSSAVQSLFVTPCLSALSPPCELHTRYRMTAPAAHHIMRSNAPFCSLSVHESSLTGIGVSGLYRLENPALPDRHQIGWYWHYWFAIGHSPVQTEHRSVRWWSRSEPVVQLEIANDTVALQCLLC